MTEGFTSEDVAHGVVVDDPARDRARIVWRHPTYVAAADTPHGSLRVYKTPRGYEAALLTAHGHEYIEGEFTTCAEAERAAEQMLARARA